MSRTFVPRANVQQTTQPRSNSMTSGHSSPVYTFLATLVLLLSVSAAIVIRSFILRRRHRRMVEEAIRNGTWVPPVVGQTPGGRPKVDLSKKPVMWEAWLGGGGVYGEKGGVGGYPQYSYSHSGEMHDWDSIKPISAAYLVSASALPITPKATTSPAPTPLPPVVISQLSITPNPQTPAQNQSPVGNDASQPQRPPLGQRIRGGLRYLFSTTSRLPTSPLPVAASSSPGNPATDPLAALGNGQHQPPSGPGGGPPVVQLSVLIAMPSPPKHPKAATSSSSGSASSGNGAGLSSADSHPLSVSNSQTLDDSEEPLPVMEMGVADLVVITHDDDDEDPLHRHHKSSRSLESVEALQRGKV